MLSAAETEAGPTPCRPSPVPTAELGLSGPRSLHDAGEPVGSLRLGATDHPGTKYCVARRATHASRGAIRAPENIPLYRNSESRCARNDVKADVRGNCALVPPDAAQHEVMREPGPVRQRTRWLSWVPALRSNATHCSASGTPPYPAMTNPLTSPRLLHHFWRAHPLL